MALDANGDGIIDASEIANAPAALRTLDKNGDGKLTPDEHLPHRPGGQGPGGSGRSEMGMRGQGGMGGPGGGSGMGGPGGQGGGPMHSPLVMALDANGDGIIDSSEIANAPAALLKLDKNHDGRLTRDEYAPPRPGGQGPGGGSGSGQEGQGRTTRPGGGGGFGEGGQASREPNAYAGASPGSTAKRGGIVAPPSTAPAQAEFAVIGITTLSNPFRLMVSGQGFKEGCTVQISGQPVPSTVFRGSQLAVATGDSLEKLLPVGVAVRVTVLNPDGGRSTAFSFTRH